MRRRGVITGLVLLVGALLLPAPAAHADHVLTGTFVGQVQVVPGMNVLTPSLRAFSLTTSTCLATGAYRTATGTSIYGPNTPCGLTMSGSPVAGACVPTGAGSTSGTATVTPPGFVFSIQATWAMTGATLTMAGLSTTGPQRGAFTLTAALAFDATAPGNNCLFNAARYIAVGTFQIVLIDT